MLEKRGVNILHPTPKVEVKILHRLKRGGQKGRAYPLPKIWVILIPDPGLHQGCYVNRLSNLGEKNPKVTIKPFFSRPEVPSLFWRNPKVGRNYWQFFAIFFSYQVSTVEMIINFNLVALSSRCSPGHRRLFILLQSLCMIFNVKCVFPVSWKIHSLV